MASTGTAFRHLAAIGPATVAANGLYFFKSPLKAEERNWRYPTYVPPPRFHSTFAGLPKIPPADDAGHLAWAVMHLEVDKVRELLQKWPHGAALIDRDDNTLFHVAASQPGLCQAQPEVAGQLFELLLQHGWQVVDQKNKNGERAEVVAKQLAPEGVPRQLLAARSHDFREKLRSECPLQLVGEQSPVPWLWDYIVQDDQRRCFAGVVKRAVDHDTCSKWFEKAIKEAPWEQAGDGRQVAWFVSEDCSDCPYRYSGNEHPPVIFPPFMVEIQDIVCGRICGIPREKYPNCCNVNLYAGGEPEVGWHADDEVYFQSLSDDTCIISFSLGSSRDFKWRLQGTDTPLGSASLGDGDVMTMEGLFQKHYKHSVPKSCMPCGTRLNFTFRWIVAKAHAEDADTAAVTGINSAT